MLTPVHGWVDFLEPGESQNDVFIPQGDDVEGDLLSDSFNVKEEGGGEPNYSCAVDGVIGVSSIDQFL